MTNIQYRFLKAIREKEKSAKEICIELGIESEEKNQPEDIGGYYNALNRAIGYLVSDEPGEMDDCFRIKPDESPYSNLDRYYISDKGREKYDQERDSRRVYRIGIYTVVLTVIGIIVAVI